MYESPRKIGSHKHNSTVFNTLQPLASPATESKRTSQALMNIVEAPATVRHTSEMP